MSYNKIRFSPIYIIADVSYICNMRVITIKDPWAYLIVIGEKNVENRTWKTNYRGKLLIHVSQKVDIEVSTKYKFVHQPGCIIGEVTLVDCVQNFLSSWSFEGYWHWILTNPILYDNPIKNIKGKLNIWNISQTESISIR